SAAAAARGDGDRRSHARRGRGISRSHRPQPSYAVSRGGSMRYDRITVEPDKMGGVPCIRGLRVPVATVVGMVAEGMTNEEILAAYPYLEADDIRQSLEYAAEAVRERELPLRRGA